MSQVSTTLIIYEDDARGAERLAAQCKVRLTPLEGGRVVYDNLHFKVTGEHRSVVKFKGAVKHQFPYAQFGGGQNPYKE